MIVGEPRLFTHEHYEAHTGTAPPYLCELVVHSLELVAQLVRRGLDFRFKGGNSLLVLLPEPRRFSIDADIVTTVEKPALIALVEEIVADCERFTRCEVRQHKTKPWLPMISFKLFFETCYPGAGSSEGSESFVMLDAVLEPPPYPGTQVPIQCVELYRCDESVEVPTVSGIMADKLLCLGPETLGIPLGKGKEAHRLKHVFDVATLSRQDHDLDAVLAALLPCMEQENRIQKSDWTLAQVIADTRVFCRAPLEHEEKPSGDQLEAGTYLDEIARGVDGFRQVLLRPNYGWSDLQADCTAILGLLDRVEAAAG
jgi:hypothetical protein